MTIRPLVALAAIVVGTATCSSTAFGQQGETVYAKVADSVFVLRVADDAGKEIATATGFVVDADVLLTNAHVLNAGHVSVQVGPISLPCDVQRVDQVNDLALCRIQAKATVSPLKLASEEPKPGSTIYAIGNPRGLENSRRASLRDSARLMAVVLCRSPLQFHQDLPVARL